MFLAIVVAENVLTNGENTEKSIDKSEQLTVSMTTDDDRQTVDEKNEQCDDGKTDEQVNDGEIHRPHFQ